MRATHTFSRTAFSKSGNCLFQSALTAVELSKASLKNSLPLQSGKISVRPRNAIYVLAWKGSFESFDFSFFEKRIHSQKRDTHVHFFAQLSATFVSYRCIESKANRFLEA